MQPKPNGKNQKIELTKGGQNVDGVFVPNPPKVTSNVPVITPQSLQPAPAVVLKQPKEPIQQTKLLSDLEVQAEDAFSARQTAEKQAAEGTKASALKDYISALQTAQTPTQLQANAYAQGGVNDLQVELNDLNDQMRREQLSLRRSVEEVQKKGGGLAGGAQAQINSLQRESLSKQADLSVIQMAAQGRYDSAREIADRAVQARLEQQQNYNDALKFNYGEIKETFNREEQQEFEVLMGNRERALQAEADKLKTIQNLALQALQDGAPPSIASQMQKAKSVEEAISLGGQYVGALDRQAKQASINASYASARNSEQNRLIELAKLGQPDALAALGLSSSPQSIASPQEVDKLQKEMVANDNYKAIQKAQTSLNALTEYEKIFKEVGTTSGVTSPFDNERLKKVHKAALLDLKEFFNLGVLNGPDLQILTDLLGDPTSQGFITNPAAKTGATEGLNQMKAKLSEALDDRFLSVATQYGAYGNQLPLNEDTQRVYVQTKAKVDPAVQALIDENPDMPLEDIIQIINTKI